MGHSKKNAIVVGSGPLGAVVVRRLVEAGVRVTLIEQGAALSRPAGSHIRNAGQYQTDPDAFLADIMPHFEFFDREAAPEGLPGASVLSAYGGQGICWTNNCPRAVPDLELWPMPSGFSWDTFYTLAEQYLGVRSDQYTASVRGRKLLPRLQSHLAARGRCAIPQPMAGHVLPDGRTHFTATADILAGCDAPEVRHLRGNVERVMLQDKSARGVIVDGRELRGDTVFLAAGTIETTLLLLRSGIVSPALGAHLSYHPVMIAQLVLDPALQSDPEKQDLPPRFQIPPSENAPWNSMVLRDVSPFQPQGGDADLPESAIVEVQFFCPIENRAENRMWRDDAGQVRFHVPLSGRDRAFMEAIRADAGAITTSLGRYRQGCEPVWMDLGFAHLMGAFRMGEDPSTSVSDLQCRPHGQSDLYLASVGLIPTAMAVNPTLSAAALAIHAVDSWLN